MVKTWALTLFRAMSFFHEAKSGRAEQWALVVLFILSLAFNLFGMRAGWKSLNLPGEEFRQAQTALSTYFIQKEGDYSIRYPTPALGKPWSIPMEFPLYQWTVAGWMNLTGMELTQAGRFVSAACLYLTLPAIFLLLGQMGINRFQRLLILGLVLCCPLYIYYGRAFLIETMALMLSMWFLFFFIEAIGRRSGWWLLAANVMGMAAGCVKVTTFMVYLIPAGIFSVLCLWRSRKNPRETLRVAAWIAGCCAVPFLATLGWTSFADEVKGLNPAGKFLQSSNLSGFNLGTQATRFAAETWSAHWGLIKFHMIWIPAVLICGASLLLLPARIRWWALASFVLFMVSQAIFPVLYAVHGYYYVANGVLLMAAMGLVLAGILDSRVPRWLACTVILFVFAGQAGAFWVRHYPSQQTLSLGGNGLSTALKTLTLENDVIVVAGDDWNSMIPYYSRRKALMVRADAEHDPRQVDSFLDNLKGERVGALVLLAPLIERGQILRQKVIERFNFDPQPLLEWRGGQLYFPREDRKRLVEMLDDNGFDEVSLAAGVVIPRDSFPLGQVVTYESLTPRQKKIFAGMSPRPRRFNSEFDVTTVTRDKRRYFGAHPITRLWFEVPPGKRNLTTGFMLAPETYNDAEKTDGVLLSVSLNLPDGTLQVLFEQFYDPAAWMEDRGYQPVSIDFEMPAGAELEISTGAGPANNRSRDWAWLGDISIH